MCVTAWVKGQLFILVGGSRQTVEDYNPGSALLYVHGILQHKRRKSLGVKLGLLHASTERISHGRVFWELPRPLSGITDGGSAEMLDNHPSTQQKKKEKKKKK